MLHQRRRKGNASQNIFPSEGWIFVKNVFDAVARRQEFKDRLCGDSSALDRRKAVANIGADDDSAHRFILTDAPEDSNLDEGFRVYPQAITRAMAIVMSREIIGLIPPHPQPPAAPDPKTSPLARPAIPMTARSTHHPHLPHRSIRERSDGWPRTASLFFRRVRTFFRILAGGALAGIARRRRVRSGRCRGRTRATPLRIWPCSGRVPARDR